MQIFLKNQLDVDRKLIDVRAELRNLQSEVGKYLLSKDSNEIGIEGVRRTVSDIQREINEFLEKYENAYIAKRNDFLLEILRNTRELSLVEEEINSVLSIRTEVSEYINEIKFHLDLSQSNNQYNSQKSVFSYLTKVDAVRLRLFHSFDELSDIRYIFAQRILFYIGGENDKQEIFLIIAAILLLILTFFVYILEHFYIHKPFRDIIMFLGDFSRGKVGQRLYFSTPIKEIKESEDVINNIIDKAQGIGK